MGRHGGRPSQNFGAFLTGKNVHDARKKGPPFLDTRARPRRSTVPGPGSLLDKSLVGFSTSSPASELRSARRSNPSKP
jgi:hypothetical protein